MVEDIAVRHLKPRLVGFDDDTRDDKRGASEFEETVGGADLLHIEHFGKDVGNGLFGIVGRSLIRAASSQLRFRQRLDIGLAIRRERHLLQLQISCRHHIFGEGLAQFSLQRRNIHFVVGGEISTEVFGVFDLTNLHHHILDALYGSQRSLNLT